jgi:hypothetical protein
MFRRPDTSRIVSIFARVWTPEGEGSTIWQLANDGRIQVQHERRLDGRRGYRRFATLDHRMLIYWEISYKDFRLLSRIPKKESQARKEQKHGG